MNTRVIDSSKRKLLVAQLKKLDSLGQLSVPLGCDFDSQRPGSWTDRLTGIEHVRTLPALLSEDGLGLSVQTAMLIDSITVNLDDGGARFAISACEELVSTGRGGWHDPFGSGPSRTRQFAFWICMNDPFGALEHMIFGRDQVKAVAEILRSNQKIHATGRGLIQRGRRLFDAVTTSQHLRPKYDATANWSVKDTPCRELLPQLKGLDRSLYDLLASLCEVQEHADSCALGRFKHPIYWAPHLAQEGSKVRDSTVSGVLAYASEALATSAVFLAVYACTLEGSADESVQKREGYIWAESLNCLARAYALRAAGGFDNEREAHDFDVIYSRQFQSAYVQAYVAFGAKFRKILHAI